MGPGNGVEIGWVVAVTVAACPVSGVSDAQELASESMGKERRGGGGRMKGWYLCSKKEKIGICVVL